MSWNIGAVIIGIMCFFLGFYIKKIEHTGKQIIVLMFGPYLASYLFYWISASIEGRTTEHGSWAPIYILPWYIIGLASTILGLMLYSKLFRKK